MTAKRITVDIETYRTMIPAVVERVRSEAMEKSPAQNVRKEIKDEWNTTRAREQRAAEAVSRTAVNVLLAEVLCVCFLADEEPVELSLMPLERGTTVEGLTALSQGLDELAGPDTIWAGHNIAGFDLQVLLNAWRRNEIRPPEHFPRFNRGRWVGRVFDTMLRTPCENGLNFVGLSTVCEAYGMGAAKSRMWRGMPMCGELVGDAYDAGEYQVIVDYCADDVRVEDALYRRMTCGGTWGTWSEDEGLLEYFQEIDGSEMSDTARKLAKYVALEAAGKVPR